VCALLIHVSARTKLRMLTDTESLARSDCDGSVNLTDLRVKRRKFNCKS